MAIPESQLETWAHQGATKTASTTHQSIRFALTSDTSPIKSRSHEVYLQGSYKNSTNIRGDSDVDIVVQLENSSFRSNIAELSPVEQKLYYNIFPNATYTWQNFRADVLEALLEYYGRDSIIEGNKSIKIIDTQSRLPADVVVSLPYRKYAQFRERNESFEEGIVFTCLDDNRSVINFPKQHYINGIRKNSKEQTGGWYKRTVRMFKNARSYLIDQGIIAENLAPSYFLECMLYNVPNRNFGESHQNTFRNVITYLRDEDFNYFRCQNEQILLFGTTSVQWLMHDAESLVDGLIELWNDW